MQNKKTCRTRQQPALLFIEAGLPSLGPLWATNAAQQRVTNTALQGPQDRQAEAGRLLADVEFAEEDKVLSAYAAKPNDPNLPQQWALYQGLAEG